MIDLFSNIEPSIEVEKNEDVIKKHVKDRYLEVGILSPSAIQKFNKLKGVEFINGNYRIYY